MEIRKQQADDLNFTLTLHVAKEDYAEKKTKALKDYRRKTDIKGFRKGMAPMSLIEKMHGGAALADAVNTVISESLNNYITENKLNILGEPLPSEGQKPIDWDNQEDFEFVFDLALAPAIDFTLSKDDRIVSYNVTVSEEAKKSYKSNMLKQFGKLENTDAVKEDDFIIADLQQGETKVEGTYITLRSIEDKTIKKKFIGKKPGETFMLNVNKAFVNETDRAALLKVKKEELAGIDPDWEVTIKEVKTFVEAEQNQDLYDRLFGKDVVKSEAEFDAKIEERLTSEYGQESDYRFMLDARQYLFDKTNLVLPEAFLKRWLYTINEGKFSMEDIEKDFALFLKDFRWQMIRQFIMQQQKLTVKKEDLQEEAKKIARYQFAMYGLNDVPEEQLNTYAESILSNEKERRRIYEKAEEDMVLDYVKSAVTLESKDITIEELRKLAD